MFLRILILWLSLSQTCGGLPGWSPLLKKVVEGECLTGYMTAMQSWVRADGALNMEFVDKRGAVDLSRTSNPVNVLHQRLFSMRKSHNYIKYLSMAKCKLTRVPLVFQIQDNMGRYMSETLEYMTFYGNNFVSVSSAGKEYDVFLNATGATEALVHNRHGTSLDTTQIWSSSLEQAVFPRLKELDLRACSIRILNPNLFRGMANLEALYIGENEIYQLISDTFSELRNLRHLDFSRNRPVNDNGSPTTLTSELAFTLEKLTKLVSLDLSHTRLSPSSSGMIKSLGKSLKSLSICNAGVGNLLSGIFEDTSLEILDVSKNNAFFSNPNTLRGIEDSLVVLNAKDTGLQSIDMFTNFSKLEILQLSNNEIDVINDDTVRTLISLQVLDVDNNRLTNWFNKTFSLMRNLRLLTARHNNINVITDYMTNDLKHLDYVAFTGNSLVCSCHGKDFYTMAAMNEAKFDDTRIQPKEPQPYNTGFEYYNNKIQSRKPAVYEYYCEDDCEEYNDTGRFRLLDERGDSYTCLNLSATTISNSKSIPLWSLLSCRKPDLKNLDGDLNTGRNLLLVLLVIPCLLVPMLIMFMFRRNLKYCVIMMRNSAMLSLINKNEVIEDGTIFNYDVFVSYCNEDRGWVLDHLLPHMEAECSVSACLHERDFQVGLSILENIVSCMDRSRLIMLIISQRFLLSQWCQFEMHLAQHRLLETRREDLILVLLEDIPRRVRPNTLHYLMLTKTYIVWPKTKADRVIFWRRMKKSLLSQKTKLTENVSLA